MNLEKDDTYVFAFDNPIDKVEKYGFSQNLRVSSLPLSVAIGRDSSATITT